MTEATAAARFARLVASIADPRVAAAPVVWLRPYHAPTVPVLAEHRAEHGAFLNSLAADPDALAPPPDWPDDITDAPATDGPVCGSCRGHCCVQGVAYHGFIDLRLLRRRQATRGGTLAEAAAYYADAVPATHVQYSCLYHGEQGCVLPRAERAPICNGYACDALLQARELQRADPAVPLLLVGEVADEPLGVTLLTGRTLDPLT